MTPILVARKLLIYCHYEQNGHKFSAIYKTKVVREPLSKRLAATQLAQKNDIHQNQIAQWKSELLDHTAEVFKTWIKSLSN